MRILSAFLAKRLRPLTFWPRTAGLLWKACPRLTIAWALLLVLQGLLPAATVYLSKLVIDNLTLALLAGGFSEHARLIMIPGLALALLLLLGELLQAALGWLRTAQAEYIQDEIKARIHQQSVVVDLAFYESPAYYDRLERARTEAVTRTQSLLDHIGTLAQSAITLLAMAGLLVTYSIWLPCVLLIGTLPAFYLVLLFDRKQHAWWQKTTEDRRRVQYYDVMLTHNEPAPEIRMFGLGLHFQQSYQNIRGQLRNQRLQLLQQQSLARIIAGVIALITAGTTLVWMGGRVLARVLTLGDLAVFYQAFSQGQALMRALLGSAGQIYTNSLFLSDLFTFLDLKPQVTGPEHPLPAPQLVRQGVRFEHVAFRYPGSSQPVINDLSLDLPAGQIAAIVGENGAGKTTLFKLLCRFYDPETGAITIDDRDIRTLAIDDLRAMISVLFQKPMPYHLTASENIAISSINNKPDAIAIERAARQAGAHHVIARLPQGYDTLLSKWFGDGAELSSGEWQRVALARAFLREAPLLLLDEPTSFMDSWSESDWFSRLRSLAHERTTILITHRFTIAMRADVIHVMHEGQIVESGTHDELVALGGRYAESWAAQMNAQTPGAETTDFLCSDNLPTSYVSTAT